MYYSKSYNFCPYCGTKNLENINSNANAYTSPSTYEMAVHALTEIGLGHLCNEYFVIYVNIEGNAPKIPVKLKGWQTSYDAIAYLRNNHYLSPDYYYFTDWPVTSVKGSNSKYKAYVCELTNKEVTLKTRNPDTMVTLYGCPNAKGLDYVLLKRTIEVITYNPS